ncbi:glycine cleavage T C-terminal barrel domain-containing protein [Diaminobutyricimonas sp. TR449]|uniref:CAF17-like 4Fe-4S cluster assembly/insertion protein YgfZ n=1 Tax=Diaminobutyricimonas sp. TR449 TaxID=2708076 RepID=UPI001FB87F88|nr:glycine cleavage T C-terminal barrel domain-containing protein [Diaminobutyricimonas sp. TR449]
MSTEFLSLPGAVGETVPQHYGNPIGEQRALAAGRAIVDLSDRAVLTVTGPDRLSWLNSITSQELGALQPGEGAETLVLGVTGRLEHAARVLDDGVSTWLLIDEASALESFLLSMRFMLRVEIEDRTAEYATIGTLGEGLVTAAAPNGVPLEWVDPWRQVVAGGHQYATAAEHPAAEWTYREILVSRSDLGSLTGLPVAGTLALEALRIAAWRPRFATEVDEKTIPHELDWLRSAVHLNKGCYRGQETVAKVHNLGHPPRRLVMLHLDGTDAVLPEPGNDVLDGDKVVGHITSVGMHHELGPIALAVIKRMVDPAHPLTVRTSELDVAAAQEVIVPPSAGAEANVPRLPRLGAVTRPQR